LKLVIDASVCVAAITGEAGFQVLDGYDLVAPALMWSECMSVLHANLWRSRIDRDAAEGARRRLGEAPVRPSPSAGVLNEAWRLADVLGWARTYDAEYLAVASLERCRLVTLDERLRRGADRLGFVVTPSEL